VDMSGVTLAPRPPRRDRPAPGGVPRPSGRTIRPHKLRREPLREDDGNAGDVGERAAASHRAGGLNTSDGTTHRRWNPSAASKRPSPPKAPSHLDKENDDACAAKTPIVLEPPPRAAFDFAAAVSSDARAFLAKQQQKGGAGGSHRHRRGARAGSSSPDSAEPSSNGAAASKGWNGSMTLDPNAWPCAAERGDGERKMTPSPPGQHMPGVRMRRRRSPGHWTSTLRGTEAETSGTRRARSAEADPGRTQSGLGETEPHGGDDQSIDDESKDGKSRNLAPAWAVARARTSYETRHKSKSAHAGSRHRRPGWNSDVTLGATDGEINARQGTPVRGLRQRVHEWRVKCDDFQRENESLRADASEARADAEAKETQIQVLLARVRELETLVCERNEGRGESNEGGRANKTPPRRIKIVKKTDDVYPPSPFSNDWSPPTVHTSSHAVDDSPPRHMARFSAGPGETAETEPLGGFGSPERFFGSSPGSAGSASGSTGSHQPDEPPSPILFPIQVSALREETSDTRTKIEEGNEGIDASAEIDAVVDGLLDWADEDDDDECSPAEPRDLPVTPEQRTPSPSRPPRSHSSRPPIPTLLPCVACADRAAELEKASVKEAELRTALDEAGLIAREYRARMHHARLDADGDGYIGLDELLRHELFASYSQAVVERVHAFFPYADRAKHGELDEDDFVKLTLWTEDRSTRDSQRFWFGVVDVDGDGVLGAHDVKWLYDSLWKEEGSCVSCEDLTCQIHDMAGVDDFHFRSTRQRGAARGGPGDRAYAPEPKRFAPRPPGSAPVLRVPGLGLGFRPKPSGPKLSDLRKSGLAPGVFGLLVNHNDMLLRRSTAEFSKQDVPM
jgi:hypothetical protein